MKKIAILLSLLLVFMAAAMPIDAKPRRSSSSKSRSSFSRSIKNTFKKSTTSNSTKNNSNSSNSGVNLNKNSSSSNNSNTSNNSSSSSSVNLNKNNSSSSSDYTVKKKTSITKNIIPKLYKNYSSSRYYSRRSNSNFWKYYGLYHLFDDDDDEISEAELVRNLEEQGYTEEEIEQILEDADLENSESAKNKGFKSIVRKVIVPVIAILVILLVICVLKFRR